MLEVTVGMLLFLLAITILVFVHELGHFLPARAMGVNVEAFSVGFGRELFGYTDSKGTRWKFCPIPLGGYVSMTYERSDGEQISPWKKMLITFCGPLASILLAPVVLIFLFMTSGMYAQLPIIEDIAPNSPASHSMLQKGDKVLKVHGETVTFYRDIKSIQIRSVEPILIFEVERGGQTISVSVDRGNDNYIGIRGGPNKILKLSPNQVVSEVVATCVDFVSVTMKALWNLLMGHSSISTLGGPATVGLMFAESGAVGFYEFMWTLALFSLNLGILNLLPIPLLDGGQIVIAGAEIVNGKPLPETAQRITVAIGLLVITCLMLVGVFADISRYWTPITTFFSSLVA